MNKAFLLKILFTALIIASSFERSFACSYGPPYRTICETYAQAASVIIGKIESVESNDSNQRVIIDVKKTFKGKNQKRIILNQPQSTCDWDFSDDEGKTLLLYLGRDKKTKTYSAISEGMGGEIEKNNNDLYWLNNLPKSLKRTRISGTIELYQDKPFEFLNYIVGTKVRIFSKQNSYEVITDTNGVYEVWDLPIGKYKIVPEMPNGFDLRFSLSRGEIEFKPISEVEVDTEDFTVEIKPMTCGGADYVVEKRQ